MTVTNTARKAGPYNGSGATFDFVFVFKVFETSDLVVTLKDVTTGLETVQTLTADYSVTLNSDQNVSPGGTVTMIVAPTAVPAETLTLSSDVPESQPADIRNQGIFYPSVIEDALDRAIILQQQQLEKESRSIVIPISDDTNRVVELPAQELRADKVLSFASNGDVEAIAVPDNGLLYDTDDLSPASRTRGSTQGAIKVYSDSGTQAMTNKTLNDFTNDIHSDAVHIKVRATEAILKGQVVYIDGYHGGSDLPTVALAEGDDNTKMPSSGIADEDIAMNANGAVVFVGAITGLDTSAFSDGDELYVGSTAGALTNSVVGIEAQAVAIVTRAHNSQGALRVHIRGAIIIDDDAMAAASTTAASSQSSAKAYTDAHGLVQRVNVQDGALATGTTAMVNDNTIPQNTEGDEYMTLAITPTNASNILYLDVVLIISHSAAALILAALFQDATADALASAGVFQTTATGQNTVSFRHKMVAGTTSATTFKVRAGDTSGATTTVNGSNSVAKLGGTYASSITITEVKV